MIRDGSRLSQFVMKPTFSGSEKPLIHELKFLLHVKHLAVFVFLLDLIHTLWLTLFRTFDIFCQITWFISLQEVKTRSCCSCFGRSWWNLSSNIRLLSFEVGHH